MTKIHPEKGDFVVMACGGLWEMLSNEEVVALVAEWIDKKDQLAAPMQVQSRPLQTTMTPTGCLTDRPVTPHGPACHTGTIYTFTSIKRHKPASHTGTPTSDHLRRFSAVPSHMAPLNETSQLVQGTRREPVGPHIQERNFVNIITGGRLCGSQRRTPAEESSHLDRRETRKGYPSRHPRQPAPHDCADGEFKALAGNVVNAAWPSFHDVLHQSSKTNRSTYSKLEHRRRSIGSSHSGIKRTEARFNQPLCAALQLALMDLLTETSNLVPGLDIYSKPISWLRSIPQIGPYRGMSGDSPRSADEVPEPSEFRITLSTCRRCCSGQALQPLINKLQAPQPVNRADAPPWNALQPLESPCAPAMDP
ncbi:hypothetical protein QBC37DRAFT_464237 [Rhypophila decipiens]|uniref:PPM-type phosphatase domain-containing protein n=1 Tax=Rhypophila decipiens TaxID=261697 RepID=A0AAN6Y8A2_9PEZI|nr:hypothetical protein QBC37DRAFT_464237 [Rhypophila decipiens]